MCLMFTLYDYPGSADKEIFGWNFLGHGEINDDLSALSYITNTLSVSLYSFATT